MSHPHKLHIYKQLCSIKSILTYIHHNSNYNIFQLSLCLYYPWFHTISLLFITEPTKIFNHDIKDTLLCHYSLTNISSIEKNSPNEKYYGRHLYRLSQHLILRSACGKLHKDFTYHRLSLIITLLHLLDEMVNCCCYYYIIFSWVMIFF